MCTAITYKTKDFYFGRTLDYDISFGEQVAVTPRNFYLNFRYVGELQSHYAIIGMAHVEKGYPLYYDAVNERGLCIAGLNFVGNAHYNKAQKDKKNVAQFELVPYLLAKCASVAEAVDEIKEINLTDDRFCESLPVAELHWLIADRKSAVTVEFVKGGVKIYDNPAGVLANNPPFPEQIFNLNNYMSLSPRDPKNVFSKKLKLEPYSRGMGAIGLPGDLSSESRFVRAAFFLLNSVSDDDEESSVNQFFHILGSVAQPRGACVIGSDAVGCGDAAAMLRGKAAADGRGDNDGRGVKKESYEITVYSSCCNADRGIYYFTTYENHRITAVDMHACDLDGRELSLFPLSLRENILYLNGEK